MIGQICSQESTNGRLSGTLGVASKAFEKGIEIVRVHDVREHKDLFDVLERLVD